MIEVQMKRPADYKELYATLARFARSHVEDILQKPYIKLGLNKLRWVLKDFGISHYLLPEMPLMDYIQIADSLAEDITKESVLDLTVYCRILAARNVLVLLSLAYEFNDNVQKYYNVGLKRILATIANINLGMSPDRLSDILLHFKINEDDTIQMVADTIRKHIEPIVDLSYYKNDICPRLAVGTDEEQDILLAYELYRLLFPLYFAKMFPISFAEQALNNKYHTTHFWNDYDSEIIQAIRSGEGGEDDADSV